MKLLSSAGLRAFLCLTLLGVVQCSHVQKSEPVEFSPVFFWGDQDQRLRELATMQGQLRLFYEMKDEGVSGKGQVMVKDGKGLRLELRDPLGRLQYVVTVHGQKMIAHYPRRKLAYIDDVAGARYVKRLISGSELTFHELHWLLLGVLPQRLTSRTFFSFDWDSLKGRYLAVLRNQGARFRLAIDPDLTAIREMRVETPRGNYRVIYRKFQSCCEAYARGPLKVARRVEIVSESRSLSLEIEWKEIHRNPRKIKDGIFKQDLAPVTKQVILK